MQKRIYLVRHGDKQKVVGDPALTELGQHQARATAAFFSNLPIGYVVSSPLLRARQTAEIIAEPLQLKVAIDKKLIERANWGDDPHQSFSDFITMWTTATNQRDWQPPIGDSSIQAGQRLTEVIDEQLEQSASASDVVLVTHAGIIADYLLNMFSPTVLHERYPGFNVGRENMIAECSITIIEQTSMHQHHELVALGSITHLADVPV